MTAEKAAQLLQKYLEDKATDAEIKAVEDWYAAIENERDLPAADKKLIGRKMLLNLQQAMGVKPAAVLPFYRKTWFRMAAMLFLCLSIGFSIWTLSRQTENVDQLVTITTSPLERKRLILSDGSEILLSPSTKIIYPEHFSANSRTIQLIGGEAFFNIAHQEQRPFTVKGPSNVDVKVLGTSFSVKTFTTKPDVTVAVATGKVAVRHGKNLVGTLIKGQNLHYNPVSKCSSILSNVHQKYVEIKFEGATLTAVVRKLEYVYNIKIILTDSKISQLKSTAVFNSKQQPEEILDILCSLHHIHFRKIQNQNTFKIYK
jgi:ferric-dicitrate binding protein FerR (iron transport regulator)